MKFVSLFLTLIFTNFAFSDNYPEPSPNSEPVIYNNTNNSDFSNHVNNVNTPEFTNNNQVDNNNNIVNENLVNSDLSNENSNTVNVNNSNYFTPNPNFENDRRRDIEINFPNVGHDYYGDGHACAKPTVSVGVAGDGNSSRNLQFAVGGTMTLGGDDCKKFLKLRERKLVWQEIDRSIYRIEKCRENHHLITIKDDNNPDLVAFRDFCNSVRIEHEIPESRPKSTRVSPH